MGQPDEATRGASRPAAGAVPPRPSSPPPSSPAPSVADLYRRPLLPGLYPPLGHAPDGTARFRPGPPPPGPAVTGAAPAATPGTSHNPADTATTPYEGDVVPAGTRRGGMGRTAIVFAVVAAVVVGLVLYGVTQYRQTTTASSPFDEPRLTLVEPPVASPTAPPAMPPGVPPTVPDTPAPGLRAGQTVTYDATIDGSGTILYVDDQGLRSEFMPPPTWHLQFIAGSNPLRLLVIAGAGSSVTCEIAVGGRVVARDRVDAETTRRTASCTA